ncbi:helix-turn-helix transcriptional regulator [Aquabacterium sp.]|uniref:helix-turn-helix transcriptional regulator n=1 Tax=Aquabacterium sp. TaxID=1872578 RepID=UPI0025BEDCE9|nr:helix-turn-helix transcriptional regulator [Aquabacterium sp.]
MQLDDVLWDGLISALYEAALAPETLCGAVAQFEACVQSDGCHMFVVDAHLQPILHQTTIDWIPQAVMDAYYSHYIHEDPRRAHTRSLRVGQAQQCSELFDASYVGRSGFYQDFLIPNGGRYVAGGKLLDRQGAEGLVAFNRRAGRPEFDAQDMRAIGRYLPHLARATTLITDARLRELRAVASEAALDVQGLGALALDALGHVLYANALARQWAPALRLLQGANMADSSDINRLVQGCHTRRQPQSIRLRQANGQEAIVMASAATARPSPAWLSRVLPDVAQRAHTLLLIKPLTTDAPMSPSQLMGLFDLTAAEARLAHALSEGLTLEDAAQRHHVSIHTVRSQLRGVLAKTTCARLSDLTALLARLPRGLG